MTLETRYFMAGQPTVTPPHRSCQGKPTDNKALKRGLIFSSGSTWNEGDRLASLTSDLSKIQGSEMRNSGVLFVKGLLLGKKQMLVEWFLRKLILFESCLSRFFLNFLETKIDVPKPVFRIGTLCFFLVLPFFGI